MIRRAFGVCELLVGLKIVRKLRILALESSARQSSVALLENDQIVAQSEPKPEAIGRKFAPGEGSSSSLIVDIRSLFTGLSWSVQDVSAIAFVTGPGSFTGLRIGIVTAKTLCYATGAKIVGLNSLDVIANQVVPYVQNSTRSNNVLRVVMNAQRSQLFCADYRFLDTGDLEAVGESQIRDREDWLSLLSPGDIVSGPGLLPIVPQIEAKTDVTVVPRELWNPTATVVGTMGARRAEQGSYDDLWTINPIYFRPSYAEE